MCFVAPRVQRVARAAKEQARRCAVTPRVWVLAPGSAQVNLRPGGDTQAVTFDNRLEFVSLALQQRAAECDAQINAMRAGFGEIVPTFILGLLSGLNLEYEVCGAPEVDIDLLESTTECVAARLLCVRVAASAPGLRTRA